jgi:hypothetical protein
MSLTLLNKMLLALNRVISLLITSFPRSVDRYPQSSWQCTSGQLGISPSPALFSGDDLALVATLSRSIKPNQAQSSPIKPNQTQSNPIKADSYLANACAAVGRPQLVPSTAWSSPIKANQGSSWEFPQKIAIKKNQSWKPNVSRNL